jgi:DNA-binding FrmR family transcriptional regulator
LTPFDILDNNRGIENLLRWFMASYVKDKDKILARLRKIEGQIRGIQRMVEEEKYCVDVLVQISSVIAATEKVGLILLDDHIRGCVRKAVLSEDGEASFEELIRVIQRFTRT